MRPGDRPPWSEFREALEAEGFRPSKTLGQNFLLDSNMARAIAGDARVGRGDFVLEVGAGCGFLTTHLVALGVRLVAVEVDRRLARIARCFLADAPGLSWIEADVLASKHVLAPRVAAELPVEGRWHLVSNLPYAIAGPLLVVLSRLANPPWSATALVQLEVAERLAARPGERAWGLLGAKLAPLYDVRRLRRVRPELFWPRPRVESAVVRLERREARAIGLAAYDALVDGLFRQRRKTLARSLGALVGREEAQRLLAATMLPPAARPQALGPEELALLAERMGARGGTGAPEVS